MGARTTFLGQVVHSWGTRIPNSGNWHEDQLPKRLVELLPRHGANQTRFPRFHRGRGLEIWYDFVMLIAPEFMRDSRGEQNQRPAKTKRKGPPHLYSQVTLPSSHN